MTIFTDSELELMAKENLGEDKANLQKDLQALKDWIWKSPHLQTIRQDDIYLLKFLRGCKFSLERTKEKLDLYYACKASLGSWFQDWNVNSPLFQKMLNCG